jgi:hypothetical protein
MAAKNNREEELSKAKAEIRKLEARVEELTRALSQRASA